MDVHAVSLTPLEVAAALRDFAVAKLKLSPADLQSAVVRCNWREDGPAAVSIAIPAAPVQSTNQPPVGT